MPLITRCFVVGLLAATSALSTAAEPEKSSPIGPISLADVLVGKGYQRLPLQVVSEQDSSFLVTLSCGKKPLKLVVDTGSTVTLLDTTTAKRLGVKPGPDPRGKALTLRGELTIELAVVSDLRFGELTLPAFGIYIADLSASRPPQEPDTEKPDGILGQDFLAHLSAVIDYDAPALYVISPLDKEWPKLRGDWVCVAGVRDGKPLEGADQWRFHFEETGKARITQAKRGTDTPLSVGVMAFGRTDRVMTVARSRTAKPAPLPFEQEAIWMQYAIRGDTLKVAFLLHPKDTPVLTDRLPATIASKAGSGVVVLEFIHKSKSPEKK
jgi:hypothetical protein